VNIIEDVHLPGLLSQVGLDDTEELSTYSPQCDESGRTYVKNGN
jgi:hypothetical protein